MALKQILFLFIFIAATQAQINQKTILSRQKRTLIFPDASSMGIFLAVGIPLDLPNRDVSVSWNFEANYNLPTNATELELGIPVVARSQRSLDRRYTYELLERKLESDGLGGRSCILRTVCEVAEAPIRQSGLVGDLLHVIFTPSSSAGETLPSDFAEAEERGLRGENCEEAYPTCKTGLLDMISIVISNV